MGQYEKIHQTAANERRNAKLQKTTTRKRQMRKENEIGENEIRRKPNTKISLTIIKD